MLGVASPSAGPTPAAAPPAAWPTWCCINPTGLPQRQVLPFLISHSKGK